MELVARLVRGPPSRRDDRDTVRETIEYLAAADHKGIAYAGETGVAKVDVSTDRGKTWNAAQIQHGPTNLVWTMWVYPWLLPASGKTTIVARVTDNNGRVQTKIGSVLADTFPDGAKDMHSVTVDVKNV